MSLAEVCEHLDLGINPNGSNVLPEAWADLIGLYAWQWFATFTFKDQVHPERADKSFRYFVALMNMRLAGRNWYRRPLSCVQWVRGLEWQKRGVIHYHALLYHPLGLDNLLLKRDWEIQWAMLLAGTKVNPRPDQLRGIARIETPRNQEEVSAYVSKYTTKDGEVDVSNNLPSKTDTELKLVGERM